MTKYEYIIRSTKYETMGILYNLIGEYSKIKAAKTIVILSQSDKSVYTMILSGNVPLARYFKSIREVSQISSYSIENYIERKYKV